MCISVTIHQVGIVSILVTINTFWQLISLWDTGNHGCDISNAHTRDPGDPSDKQDFVTHGIDFTVIQW